MKFNRLPVYSILDNIRSMYNVGSIFRTSDGVCLKKLILCGMTAYPPRKEIDKTALGAVENVPWVYYSESLDVLHDLKVKKVPVIIAERCKKSISYLQLKIKFPVAIVFGHEVHGVQQDVQDLADERIEIPMDGLKESLNVAVAYGIILYHLRNQYFCL